MTTWFTWKRYGGYEVSSKGDSRFSAFYARLPDGRTIEHHYQCDVKGYDPGGINWKRGKGKPPLAPKSPEDLYQDYLALWQLWATANDDLVKELLSCALDHNRTLSDRFANSPVNQARALADILNAYVEGL